MKQDNPDTGTISLTEAPLSPVSGSSEPIPQSLLIPEKKHYGRLILVIVSLIALIVIIGAGIGYYYLEIMRPVRDAKQLVQLYDDIGEFERLMQTGNILDNLDYTKVLDVLGKREEFLVRTQNRLLDLKLTKNVLPTSLSPHSHQVAQTFKDFSSLIELGMAVNSDAKQKAIFLQEAMDVLVALGRFAPRVQEVRESILDPRQPRNAEALLADWEIRIPKVKEIGGKLFAKEPPKLNKADALQLKISWEKALIGLDDILVYLRAQDDDSELSFPTTLPQPQSELEVQQYPRIEDVNQFLMLMESTLSNNNVQYLLSAEFYNEAEQAKLKDLSEKVKEQITQLKQLWPQLDLRQNLSAPEPPPRIDDVQKSY